MKFVLLAVIALMGPAVFAFALEDDEARELVERMERTKAQRACSWDCPFSGKCTENADGGYTCHYGPQRKWTKEYPASLNDEREMEDLGERADEYQAAAKRDNELENDKRLEMKSRLSSLLLELARLQE